MKGSRKRKGSKLGTASDGLTILGNRRIGIPYQDGFRSEPFVVPVMVRVGDSITISPILNPTGSDALHTVLQQEIMGRMDKQSKNKEENLSERYQQVRKEMDEALSEKAIAY